MSEYRKQIIEAVSSIVAVIVIMVLIVGFGANYAQSPLEGSTTSLATSATSTLSVPPPTTSVRHLGCTVSNASRTSFVQVLINNPYYIGPDNANINLSVTASSLGATACSYTYTEIITPVNCGDFCGGIGYEYYDSFVWKLNFSLVSLDNPQGDRNLTIVSSVGLTNLFPESSNELYVTSQQITSSYSIPPCYGAVEDCMGSNSTSIAIQLPTRIVNGTCQLVVNSSQLAVP